MLVSIKQPNSLADSWFFLMLFVKFFLEATSLIKCYLDQFSLVRIILKVHLVKPDLVVPGPFKYTSFILHSVLNTLTN